MIIRVKFDVGFRIIPALGPKVFGNGNCIQTENFHFPVTCLSVLEKNFRDREQTKSSLI